MVRVSSLLLLAFLGVTPTVLAQTPPPPVFEIEGLVVTATAVPLPLSALGTHVTVVEGADLRARGVTRVLDALREVPGLVVVQGGSFGAITSVFLRGGESDHVQVLVDGVKVNQPGGAYDFASLTTENVDRIEIVRGPSSALYGSDAMSGVIHVITRAGDGSPRGSITARAGSFGRQDLSADLSGGSDDVSYAFVLSRLHTDGVLAFNNAHENTVFSGNVELRADEATAARLSIRAGQREYHFPTDGSGNVVDENALAFQDEVSIGLNVSRVMSDRLALRAALMSYEVDGGSDDLADGPADTLGFFGFTSLNSVRRTAVDLRANLSFAPTTVATVGLEFEDQSQRSFSESLSEYGPSTGRSDDNRWNRGAYGHLVTSAGPLSANGGLRFEDNQRFGEFVTWQFGAAYAFSETGRVRGAGGRGIKEPTFFENYASGFARGNPDLEPERSTSWEVGIEQELVSGALLLQATYFDQSFSNLIQYTFSTPNPTDPNYYNAAAGTARGIELGVVVSTGALRAAADLTWLDTEASDSGFDEGEGATFVEGAALLRRPETRLNASVAYAMSPGTHLSLTARRVGPREDRDFTDVPAMPVTLDAYTVVDVGAEFRLVEAAEGRPGFTLTLRGENLLDESYQEVFGFGAPGRGLYVGGRMTLGGS